MFNAPLVSVLMTAYNRERYIGEAIQSVLNSNYTNFELIIVDDCSTDSTVTIAKQYEAKDSRIRLYVNGENLKQFPNRNRAISYAKGEYVVHVDSDDTILPDGISYVINAMLQFPSSSFGMYYANEKKNTSFLMEGAKAIHNHFFKEPFLVMGPGTTVLKREFFLDIDGYPTVYEAAGDMYFNLKACCFSSIVLMPYLFVNYRIHEQQELNNPYSYIYNNHLYLKDALNNLPLGLAEKEKDWLRKKNVRRLFVNICRYFFKTFNFKKTIYLLKITNFTINNFLMAIFQL